ncbi:MAG: toprim domain-containing protein [Chloroflexota bacterium]
MEGQINSTESAMSWTPIKGRKPPRAYIARRGMSAETIDTFKVGFALNSWDACRTHFLGQGYSEQDLLDVGLLTENPDKGTRYDRFRNRVLIPIRDITGRTVGFGARTLDPDGVPKYLNSPQTLLFDKSKLLFGLDMAKRHVREARQVVIVEGYMDVITAWQAGFKNVVAQMGTALTPTQLQLLKRSAKRFVIALDADVAGINATLRSLNVARETLDRDVEIRFDPTGLIREEGRLQADIRIASMPEGEDPDSIIQKDPDMWRHLVKNAKTVVEFVTSLLIEQSGDPNDPIVKTEIAQKVIPLIKDISNPVARDHYWQYLARSLRIDERALRQLTVSDGRQKKPPRSVIDKPAKQPAQASYQKGNGVGRGLRDPQQIILRKEEYFLAECLANPMKLRKVNLLLSETGEPIVHSEDFSQSIDRTIFLLIHQSHSTGSVVTTEEMWDSLEGFIQQRIVYLQQISLSESKDPIRFLVLSILECRHTKENQLIAEIKQLLRDARIENNEDAIGLLEQKWYKTTMRVNQLNRAKRSLSSLSRRV